MKSRSEIIRFIVYTITFIPIVIFILEITFSFTNKKVISKIKIIIGINNVV